MSIVQDRESELKDQALPLETLGITHYHYSMIRSDVKQVKITNLQTGELASRTPPFQAPPVGTRPSIPAREGEAGLDGIDIALAPLCGISDWIYRRICLEHGADLVVTEMISSDALTRGTGPLRTMRNIERNENRLAVQIFGSDPARMGEAAEILSGLNPRFIDLNFGCPVRKVVKGNGGAALLRDFPLLERICRTVVERSSIPVSAKIRIGWDRAASQQVCRIARIIESAGIQALTVHARTRVQAFAGKADWDYIRAVKEEVSIPVIGNGDVRSVEDYAAMRQHTGCDAVMIGRAAIGNPWIFSEIKGLIRGCPVHPPSPRERIAVLIKQVQDSAADLGEPLGIIAMRRVIAAYLKHLPGAREIRGSVLRFEHREEIEAVLERYMEANGW
jgi:tRNA-dihydrouridine synthase B